jgi:hypothetical protein
MATLAATLRLFRRLERLFWLVWLVYPATIAIAVWQTLDVSYIKAMMKTDPAGCVESLPILANFSVPGKIAFWLLFASTHLFFISMLILVHRAIRRFARGEIFVLTTLGSVRSLGLLIVGWAVYESACDNLLLYLLYRLGDIQTYRPSYSLDVPTLAVGLFILTFKFILERAVRLQEDVDLTI